MASSCEGCGTQVWAYCLMPNPVHLFMVPGEEDGLRCAVAEAHRRYTRMINFRHGWRGRLWQERFHSFVMDARYLLAAVRYVERNPLRAGLCKSVEGWCWSIGAHYDHSSPVPNPSHGIADALDLPLGLDGN
jgi:putative transposase